MGTRMGAAGWDDGRTASAAVLRPMLAFAASRGVGVDALLGELGLSRAIVDDFDHRIPEALRTLAWRRAAEMAGDDAFGLNVAQHAAMGAYEVLDYALSYSSTLADAIERVCRFQRLLTDALDMTLLVEGGTAIVRRHTSDPVRHENEVVWALLVLRARIATGREIIPQRVRFKHAAPRDASPHAALFRCPVEFGSEALEIVLSAADLALTMKQADPALTRLVDHYMSEHAARLPETDSFLQRARAVVAESLSGGRPTLRAMARALRASPRSVQRRLQDLGTTHRQLVEETRRAVAERLIAQDALSITEVAFLLGFADVSGFRRTFKRWTGHSPTQARARVA